VGNKWLGRTLAAIIAGCIIDKTQVYTIQVVFGKKNFVKRDVWVLDSIVPRVAERGDLRAAGKVARHVEPRDDKRRGWLTYERDGFDRL
jgi:hypothetical protein